MTVVLATKSSFTLPPQISEKEFEECVQGQPQVETAELQSRYDYPKLNPCLRSMKALAKQCPTLTAFDISFHCRDSEGFPEFLAANPQITRIRMLVPQHIGFTTACGERLKAVIIITEVDSLIDTLTKGCTKIEELTIDIFTKSYGEPAGYVTDKTLETIATRLANTLRVLKLQNVKDARFTEKGFQLLASSCPNLRVVSLPHKFQSCAEAFPKDCKVMITYPRKGVWETGGPREECERALTRV